MTDRDEADWADYVREVRPLAGRTRPPPPPREAPTAPAPPAPTVAPRRALPPPDLATGRQPPGLDKASWSRFQSGKMAPARTLDLHGKTAQAAYQALERFLHIAHADRLRCVEIITGRGSGEHGGVIRRELPLWLNLPALRPMILAAAHPHAANQGATRLLLRRVK
ncbi:MAG: Smr/MutS family protein [Rhodospirillales bacterium]